MQEAFRHGGWGMYPTLLVGLVLVISSLAYAWRPDRHGALIARRLAILTSLVSVLGFTTGVIKCFTSVAGSDWRVSQEVVNGVGEALNCIGLGMVLLTLSCLLSVIGAIRARARGAELLSPQ